MSYDLFLGTTKKNWAREVTPVLKPVTAASPGLSLTPAERARVRQLATLRAKAEGGNPAARREWRKVMTSVVALRVRARGGDPRAVRACQVIEETGLFGKSARVTTSGADPRRSQTVSALAQHRASSTKAADDEESLGEFVGDEERAAREAGGSERVAASRIGHSRGPREWQAYRDRARSRIKGAYPTQLLGQWRGKGRERRRHLRRLLRRSLRGDAAATARVQQLTARLTQRSQAGDARASALLQQVQQETAREQARLATQPPPQPYAPSPLVPTPLVPAPLVPTTTPYPPPGAPPVVPPTTSYPPPAQYDDSYDY